jgi:CubicO group peptidase (beta-lactamase class C family)
MKLPRLFTAIAVFSMMIPAPGCKNTSPAGTSLPRSIPEAEGVSSEELLTFLDSAVAGRHEFHSIMILRHGNVIAEGWWDPYRPELRHTLYSVSKSFTSSAVGFAISEKLLSVDDKVVSFFPDQLPDTVSPFLFDMTVRDLLTMTAGQNPDPSGNITSSGINWVPAFFNIPVVDEPGSRFLYNSMATFMLSAIVQKVTGEKLAGYLQPRLFGPLGIEGMDWESSPEGINAGGWGLRVKTEDMAKFGQLYLQKGMWNGREILPAAWVEEATSFKIDQAPDAPSEIKAGSDWMQGYCYQFWRCRHNTYRADGAFGQYIIVMPEKDAVVAITSESPDMQDVMNMVWKYILPAMKEEPLPENKAASEELADRLESLSLPVPPETEDSPVAGIISNRRYLLEENNLKLKYLTLDFSGNACSLSLGNGETVRSVPFGRGEWITSSTEMAGPGILRQPGVSTENLVAGACSWENDSTLILTLRYTETPHHLKMTCSFIGDSIHVRIRQSTPPGYDLPELTGVLAR